MTMFGLGDIKRKSFEELVECIGRDMNILKTRMDELHRGMATLSENQLQLSEEIEQLGKQK